MVWQVVCISSTDIFLYVPCVSYELSFYGIVDIGQVFVLSVRGPDLETPLNLLADRLAAEAV